MLMELGRTTGRPEAATQSASPPNARSGQQEGDPTPSPAASGSAPQEPTLLVGDLIDRTAHAGFGFMAGTLALISGPFVGLSLPFGLAIAFGAVQMMIGLERPWLPKFIRRMHVSPRVLRWISERLARWTARLERWVRPRFEVLTRGPFWSLCGLSILIQALMLSVPLPIPGSNIPFIVTIVLYAIGLLEKDGLLIMVCHAMVSVQLALAMAFWGVVREAFRAALAWLAVA